jgi:uncharacterized protein CbrC (UPF0167 family)
MPFATAAGIAAGIGAAGSIAGSVIQGSAASSAAGKESSADKAALAYQQQQQGLTTESLAPYNNAGTAAAGQLNNVWSANVNNLNSAYSGLNSAYNTVQGGQGAVQNAIGAYTNDYGGQVQNAYSALQAAVPQTMTEANLVNTPGYQFNLSQGLQATQNSAAAKGLGVSGAAMNASSKYATGLADSTYQNQFSNEQTLYGDANTNYTAAQANLANLGTGVQNAETGYNNLQNQYTDAYQNFGAQNTLAGTAYGELNSTSGLGESAAAGNATTGANAANSESQLTQAAGTANALGTTSSAADYGSLANNAVNSGTQDALSYLAAQNQLGGSGANGSSWGSAPVQYSLATGTNQTQGGNSGDWTTLPGQGSN